VCRADNLSMFMCRLSENPAGLNFPKPLGSVVDCVSEGFTFYIHMRKETCKLYRTVKFKQAICKQIGKNFYTTNFITKACTTQSKCPATTLWFNNSVSLKMMCMDHNMMMPYIN
jgi:hypothetical protein